MLLNNSVIIDYGLLCYLLRMIFLDLSVFIGYVLFLCFDRDLSTKFLFLHVPRVWNDNKESLNP